MQRPKPVELTERRCQRMAKGACLRLVYCSLLESTVRESGTQTIDTSSRVRLNFPPLRVVLGSQLARWI